MLIVGVSEDVSLIPLAEATTSEDFVRAWIGSPGHTLARSPWSKVPTMVRGVSWGHLWVALPPDLFRVLRMLALSCHLLEIGKASEVVVMDASRCIPGGSGERIFSVDGFAVSVGGVQCTFDDSLGLGSPCPNRVGTPPPLDWAVLGVSLSTLSEARNLLRFGCDPRACLSISDLTKELARYGCLSAFSQTSGLSDIVCGHADLSNAAIVTIPFEVGTTGDFLAPCRHPSATGVWDVERLLGRRWAVVDSEGGRRLPGGIEIDTALRGAVIEGLWDFLDGSGPPPPDPWTNGPSSLLRWLESPKDDWRPGSSRYWDKVWDCRSDVSFAFPEPDGEDSSEFRKWCERRFVTELVSPLISPPSDPSHLVSVPQHEERTLGINLVGYLSKGLGLGEAARALRDQTRHFELPVAEFPYWRSASPTEHPVSPPFHLPYQSNLVVITADQVRYLLAETPPALWIDHFNVGYWFWELEHVPERMVSAASVFDEIWVATEFVRGALERVLDKPVRLVPLPVRSLWENAAPTSSGGVASEPCRFLVTLDLNSVIARKNPVAAIDAYQLAFPVEVPGGPSLLVKTLNGHLHPAEVHSLRRRTVHRSDIEVRDEVLSRSDQDALIASSSCLVSLHRSEGLGLHLAEAMALGVPVIATGYSGNLDFMNNSNSRLIDYELVDIDNAGPYTGCGKWAEPDVEAAARAMQELEGDRRYRMRLSEAARDSIRSYSQEAEISLGIALQELVAHPVGKSARE